MRAASALAVAGLAAMAFAGCGGSSGEKKEGSLSGTVRTDGSDDVGSYLLEAAKDFEDANPGVRVTVGASGGDSGIEKFCAGEVDIAAAARAMTPAELERCRESSRLIATVPIAADATVLTASSDLELRCLTSAQYERLLAGGDGETEPLSRLGSDPDTGKPLPSAAVDVYRADETAGSGEDVADRVAGSESALGSLSYSDFLAAEAHGIDLVSIDDGHGCVPPGTETISDASYPLTHSLFLFVDGEARQRKPELAAFLRWLADHQEADAEAAHVQQLPENGARKAARLLGAT